jgi:hypothetical protein
MELADTPIGSLDTLIAAIELANGLILITHNTGEFGRVNGLQIEDWKEIAALVDKLVLIYAEELDHSSANDRNAPESTEP